MTDCTSFRTPATRRSDPENIAGTSRSTCSQTCRILRPATSSDGVGCAHGDVDACCACRGPSKQPPFSAVGRFSLIPAVEQEASLSRSIADIGFTSNAWMARYVGRAGDLYYNP